MYSSSESNISGLGDVGVLEIGELNNPSPLQLDKGVEFSQLKVCFYESQRNRK